MATYDLRNTIPSASQIAPGDILNAPYDNKTFTVSLPAGTYTLEAWGGSDSDGAAGGGYATGRLSLSATTTAYLVPGSGKDVYHYAPSHINGGQDNAGDASDVRLLSNSLYNRILVAGGAGGYGLFGSYGSRLSGGVGGGTQGGNGISGVPEDSPGQGGTQTSGGSGGVAYDHSSGADGTSGSFGAGGTPSGGGGWYGGGGRVYSILSGGEYYGSGAGGGSGFVLTSSSVSNVPTQYASALKNSAYYLTNTQLISGDSSMPNPDGGTMTGNKNAGYVRITVINVIPKLATPSLSASYTLTSTTISWSAISGTNVKYKVWRGSTYIGEQTATTYVDSTAGAGTSYTYKVTAIGTNAFDSDQASISTSNNAQLATPTGLIATYTLDSTTISWDAVKSATSYRVYRGTSSGFTPSSSNLVSTQTGTSYVDDGAGKATSYTYKVIASNSPKYYDSATAAITSHNPQQLNAVTNLAYSQTVSSVTLTWDEPANATQYVISRSHRAGNNFVDDYTTTVSATTFTDNTTQPGTSYLFSVTARANDYWDSLSVGIGVDTYSRLRTPTLLEVRQTDDSVTLSVSGLTAASNVVISRDGTVIATLWPGSPPQTVMTYTDTGLESQHSYVYSAYNKALRQDQYDSEPVTLWVFIGKTYTQIERQRSYLRTLKMPFFKLCRLRFLYPNGTTAFALDNNPRNRRSKAFIQEGTVNANMQNGQRLTASVTIANANQEFDFNINKIWFGQDIAIDEGLILPNGEEYWRQTGVFVIDNPQETVNPNTKTVTYNLVDKWADLDGTLDGNLEGTYEVPINTNIYTPIAALLTEDRGNGRPVDNMNPVFTEYFNGKTQGLPDGTTASMVLSPYTLTVDGDGGTIGEVVLGLGGMVNAWVGYDNTGRLRVEPSQDDILDAQKAVLYRFNMDEVTLLGLAYTIKKEDLFNDYIVVGEQMDDYAQPGGRAENLDPRSDTNINIIGRKTKRENASGFATVTQCKDLAEWKLKRSGVLQKAVNISCSQMFHIELNSLVEIVRSDKPGNPTERHLIQGYSRPLATSGRMTITVVSVNDFPIATVSEWPPAT